MRPRKILLEEKHGVATLALNRPDRDNAVDSEMMKALVELLANVTMRGISRVLVLQGNGLHFCAGREPGPVPPKGPKEWADTLSQITRVNRLLTSFPGISVALVRGKAFGFGFGLAIQCDFTMAADDAQFAFPEIKAGLPPTIVMSYIGRLMARKKAFELVITGRQMDAYETYSLGLVNRVVPTDRLASEGERLISLLLEQDTEALKVCKGFFRDTAHLSSEDATQYGISLLANFMSGGSRGSDEGGREKLKGGLS
ncbi:MAG: enoyl-CoA hydratase/isomerase family protein [Candidatus Binatia bacterium]